MDFRLLGPFEIEAGEPVRISRRRERCLLAVLLLEQGRGVPAERLADLLWDGPPPLSAHTALRSHVSRLRTTLGTSTVQITRKGRGYLLRTDPERIDAHRFRALVHQARQLTPPDRRASVLRSALDLWRGPVLADITGKVREVFGAGLEELRLEALDQRIGADLALGQHRAILAELRELVATQPSHEPFVAHLMLALHRAGRQADALSVYDESRRVLAHELGLNPGPELRRLHGRILRADSALDPSEQIAVAAKGIGSGVARQTPRQLPHDIANFTGRHRELAELDALAGGGRARGRAPTIVLIDGAPGTGKTTLAVHWAQRAAERYPDAQLYLNLHGYGPGDPVSSAEAAERLLQGLGVDGELIPPGVEARSALLRSTLVGRRALMLLDNARDCDQVRPLLPGTPSLVIVTSRNQLRGLSVRDGAHRVTMHRLSQNQAVTLLATAVGTQRVTAEPSAATRLVELCDHLPLALALVAERARRTTTLAEVVDALADEKTRLDNLGSGEGDADLRAALSWSYRALGNDAGTMFRKLGLHPANDIGVETAAALAGLPLAAAQESLAELVAAHLVEQRRPNRYEQPDLIRLYATELANTHETAGDREAAVRRVLDWYLHAAISADTQLLPHRRRDFASPYEPQTPPPDLSGPLEATRLFEQEYDSLRSVAGWAATNGWAGHAWRIAVAMTAYFDSAIPWRDGLEAYQAAFRAAQAAGERLGEAYTLNSLGSMHLNKGDPDRAKSCFERSLARFHEMSLDRGEAMALGNLALVCVETGDHDNAGRHATRALQLCVRVDYRHGIALNLDNLGVARTAAGDYERAIESHQQAHMLNRVLGDTASDAKNQHHLGRAYAGLGDTVNSTRAFSSAISTYQAMGNQRWKAIVLDDLGTMLNTAGHPGLARAIWETALVTLKKLADPRAQEIGAAIAMLSENAEKQP